MLKASRAKDRPKMAQQVFEILSAAPEASLAIEQGYLSERCIAVHFRHASGLAVTVEFDGGSAQDREGCFCMAWHIASYFQGEKFVTPETRISDAFGIAMQSSVNPFHHRKCTAFGDGFEDLCAKLTKAVAMFQDGTAFR